MIITYIPHAIKSINPSLPSIKPYLLEQVNPMYNEPGLGSGASYGSLGHAVVERASADSSAAAVASVGTSGAQLYDTYHPGVRPGDERVLISLRIVGLLFFSGNFDSAPQIVIR